MLESILQYIISNGLAVGAATDIFKDYMPSEQKVPVLIAINEYAGTGNAEYTAMSVRSVQVLTRSKNISQARQKSWEIFKLLCPDNLLLTLGDRIAISKSRNTPTKLSVDSENRTTYFFNIAITTHND